MLKYIFTATFMATFSSFSFANQSANKNHLSCTPHFCCLPGYHVSEDGKKCVKNQEFLKITTVRPYHDFCPCCGLPRHIPCDCDCPENNLPPKEDFIAKKLKQEKGKRGNESYRHCPPGMCCIPKDVLAYKQGGCLREPKGNKNPKGKGRYHFALAQAQVDRAKCPEPLPIPQEPKPIDPAGPCGPDGPKIPWV